MSDETKPGEDKNIAARQDNEAQAAGLDEQTRYVMLMMTAEALTAVSKYSGVVLATKGDRLAMIMFLANIEEAIREMRSQVSSMDAANNGQRAGN